MEARQRVDEELDSQALLAQGDELLRSSRRLLDQIGEIGTVDLRDADDEADADDPAAR